MKSRFAVPALALLALAIPVAANAGSAEEPASAAKKKLSYCQKQGKSKKGKLFGKVKDAKFFLYTKKKPTEYFFCSESPKYSGTIEAWDGIKKTSNLKAVKNNCAIFYTEGTPTTDLYSGEKELKIVAAKFFKKGAVKQTQGSVIGKKDETVSLESLSLAKNCVFAAGYMLNGVPTLKTAGIGNFPYQGFVTRTLTGATAAELKAVKVTMTSATSATVSWTQGGVPKSLNYTATGVQ